MHCSTILAQYAGSRWERQLLMRKRRMNTRRRMLLTRVQPIQVTTTLPVTAAVKRVTTVQRLSTRHWLTEEMTALLTNQQNLLSIFQTTLCGTSVQLVPREYQWIHAAGAAAAAVNTAACNSKLTVVKSWKFSFFFMKMYCIIATSMLLAGSQIYTVSAQFSLLTKQQQCSVRIHRQFCLCYIYNPSVSQFCVEFCLSSLEFCSGLLVRSHFCRHSSNSRPHQCHSLSRPIPASYVLHEYIFNIQNR